MVKYEECKYILQAATKATGGQIARPVDACVEGGRRAAVVAGVGEVGSW